MSNILKFYKKDESGENIPFPSDKEPLQVCEYEYKADKMGGKPTITATVKHTLCLDNLWNNVFTVFNGEEYYVKNIPTSTKDNTDQRYVHDVTFSSARDILETVYFIDAVQGDSTEDVYKSNSTKVLFMGDIKEYVGRLNACIQYVGLPYTVVIDEGITSEAKLVSFEDKYLIEALQEIYNIYELSYYFDGLTIHIGEYQYEIEHPFEYGIENGLLSIKKENANYKIFNRCTGIGGSNNIPYYYPNSTPNGNLSIQYYNGKTPVEEGESKISISDESLFLSSVKANDVFRYHKPTVSDIAVSLYRDGQLVQYEPDGVPVPTDTFSDRLTFSVVFTLNGSGSLKIKFLTEGIGLPEAPVAIVSSDWSVSDNISLIQDKSEITAVDNATALNIYALNEGTKQVTIQAVVDVVTGAGLSGSWKPVIEIEPAKYGLFMNERTQEIIDTSDIGIGAVYNPYDGFGFSQKKDGWITPMANLMPSVYRKTNGAERFYNALNDTYIVPNTGSYYSFDNEYTDETRSEGKLTDEEIYPTIKNVTNASGSRIDMIADIAFDETDSDEIGDENKYIHPYFFVKLKKFDGENGFNLFDQIIEGQAMTIEFTDGVCGSCKFEIGVSEDDNKTNVVQVNDDGTLKRDDSGNVIRSGKGQERQNDTSKNEVWIALKKEESTYGQIMPNATQNLKPSVNDHFVITGISLPQAYITAAEKKLDEAIIEYMAQNNTEKFTFSIVFSRIFLQNNPDILGKLNENSKLNIRYNNVTYPLFVDSYSYKMNEGEALPEITVSLTDTLAAGSSSMSNIINAVKKELLSLIQGVNSFNPNNYIRKDVPDYAYGNKKFYDGIEVGEFVDSMIAGSGAAITKDGTLKANRAEIRGSLSVLDLVINEIHAMSGDFSFTDFGAIEKVDFITNSTYKLWLRKDTDSDITTLEENDVLYSIINNIKLGGSDYYTSWMRVVATNTNDNAVIVVLWPDTEVPDGKNYAPIAGYNVTRRGNSYVPAEDEPSNERAQSWLLSSREGRIMFLQNVYKPILEDYNYALTIGKIPKLKALEHIPVSEGELGIVAQTIITQNFYQFDYNGNVVSKRVPRGAWSLETAQGAYPYRYITKEYESENGTEYTQLEQHTVEHYGCTWGCIVDQTQDEPMWNSPGWVMLQGDQNYHLEFESSNGWQFFLNQVNTDVSAIVSYGNRDITNVLMASTGVEVEWLRDTGNVPADNSWKPTYVNDQKNVILLSVSDMGSGWGREYRKVSFICRVFIPVGEDFEMVENRINIKI